MTDTIPNQTESKPCCGPSCCGSEDQDSVTASVSSSDPDKVRSQIRASYGRIAAAGSWSAAKPDDDANTSACVCATPSGGGGCCGGDAASSYTPEQLAAAIGYSDDELADLPQGANMGLSCGNPTAIASLKPGEVVLDLGAGGGFDCFIAGRKVGPSGRVIGVDMTAEMISKSRRNVEVFRRQTGLNNVEFRLGEIEHLPVADNSIDVIISNCVINLSPDKEQAWKEIARVLKPGTGRVAISDLAWVRPLPDKVRKDAEALIGCIAGAVLIEETRRLAEVAAGLVDVRLCPKPEYIDAMTNWEDPLYRRLVETMLPAGMKPSDYIVSIEVTARKR